MAFLMLAANGGRAASGRPRCSEPGLHPPSSPAAVQTGLQRLGSTYSPHSLLGTTNTLNRGRTAACAAVELSNQPPTSLATVADVQATLKER